MELIKYWQLINHGVAHEVSGNLMKDVAEFFKQPLEAKREFSQPPGSLEGYGQAFVASEEQRLDWADMLYLQVQPSESRYLKLWPTHPESFR
jgi:isopenicillin N synthase-like dioxygenase